MSSFVAASVNKRENNDRFLTSTSLDTLTSIDTVRWQTQVSLILQYADRFSVSVTRHYVSKGKIQVLKQLSNMKLMSVNAPRFKPLRASPSLTQMCLFMLVIEELTGRVSVEQPSVSPL